MLRCYLMLFPLLVVATPARAGFLDGQREGFFVSVGLGGAYSTHVQEFKVTLPDSSIDERSDRENTWGPSISLRIGAGLGDKMQVFYHLSTVWFDEPTSTGTKEEIVVSAHSGFGLTFFQKETTPSLYYFGSVGFSHWWAPFADDGPFWTGFGIIGGIGFEFVKRLSLETMASWGNPKTEINSVSVWSFIAAVRFTLY